MNKVELKNKIEVITAKVVKEKGFISSIDLLLELNYLTKSDLEKWRFGKVDFLERVCSTNLSKLSFINKILRMTAHDLNLKESWTAYMKFGKGKKLKLRFSKSNDENIEKRYSTHYVLNKKRRSPNKAQNVHIG